MMNQPKQINVIDVDIESHLNQDHSIWVGSKIINEPTEHFKDSIFRNLRSDICIISNENIAKIYLKELKEFIKKTKHDTNKIIEILIPDGEEYKNLEQLNFIWDRLLDEKFTRGSTTIISLGGGVITDISGFAASTYKRGVDIIHIPTSLLAQIDAAIGGKTAINHKLGKNMIGSFYQPREIILDSNFLHTLPVREFNSAMSEAIKYGLIWDEELFNWLISNQNNIKNKNPKSLNHLIKSCAQIKSQIITQDPHETRGLRKFLNLGHTFGHAIEKTHGYGAYTHGEAVGIGILLALEYSHEVFENSILNNIRLQAEDFLTKFNLPVSIKLEHEDKKEKLINALVESMLLDKKNTDKKINLVLVKSLAEAISYTEEPNKLCDFLNKSIYII